MFYPSRASKPKANSPQIKLDGRDTTEFHPTDHLRMTTAEHNCQSGRQYWVLGPGKRLITEDDSGVGRTGAIRCRQRLGARIVRGLVAGGRPEP
jgi:hypothetical protein